MGFIAESRRLVLEHTAALDVHGARTVDHDFADVAISQQRLQRSQPENVIEHLKHYPVAHVHWQFRGPFPQGSLSCDNGSVANTALGESALIEICAQTQHHIRSHIAHQRCRRGRRSWWAWRSGRGERSGRLARWM